MQRADTAPSVSQIKGRSQQSLEFMCSESHKTKEMIKKSVGISVCVCVCVGLAQDFLSLMCKVCGYSAKMAS